MDSIAYSLVVANTGPVALSGVSVADATCDAAPTLTGGDTDGNAILDPGETWTFDCAHLVTPADLALVALTDSATVTTTAPDCTAGPTATASASVDMPAGPAIGVSEATSPALSVPVKVGVDTIGYTFSVRNRGNVALTGISLTALVCHADPVLSSGNTNGNWRLEPGESW